MTARCAGPKCWLLDTNILLDLVHHPHGAVISTNDMLISAHAPALGSIAATANVREFQRVPGLRVENWLAP